MIKCTLLYIIIIKNRVKLLKYLNKKKFKTIFLLLCLTLVVLSSLDITTDSSISPQIGFNSNDEEFFKDSEHTFIYSLNGKQYLAEYITREKVEEMKKDIDFKGTKRVYNEIIDGHGTGYSAPTEEDLDALVGKMSLLELVSDYKQGYMATADISTEIYFPVVGDQGMQGSCTSWANVYYAYGYLEAKDYGWDASSGNPNYLLSPAWSYNKIAAYDYGSMPVDTAELIKEWGVATLSTMPYNEADVDSWGDEAAWREAPYHRPIDYTLITYIDYFTIDVIKSLLDSGTPVTIGIDAYQFYNGLEDSTGDYILSSDEYDPSGGLNHAQCFVGYDDSISEGSDVGAFRVVNSWGAGWMDNGYYWLTYDALHEFGAASGQEIIFLTDRIDYNPDLIATWEFSPGPTRMGDILTLGVGPHDSPLDLTTPHYDYDENNLFPEFMAFDISDFYSHYVSNNDVFFYLEIGPSDTTGTISSFKLERYSGGTLVEISKESPDTAEDTPGYVNATFMIFTHELKMHLKVPTNPTIHNSYQIEAIIINNGASDETSVDFDLFLNNVLVYPITIPNLPSGANTTINYLWTPIEYDIYNFTAQVVPVSGETYLTNNFDTEILYILGPIFYDDFESGLSKWVSITGLWHLTGTSSAWSNPYHSPIHSMWFGNESTGNYDTGFQEVGDLTSTTIDLTNIDVAFLEFYHWREGEGSSWDVSSVYISIDGLNWDLIYQTSESYIVPWEKVSVDISAYTGNPSVQLRFNFDTIDSISNNYRGWLIDDVVIMGAGVVIPHDLRVSLDVPEYPELFNTYTVNATITNTGTNVESNVDLFLYLDGVLVDSIHISSFPSGSSQTINYLWTPTDYGEYNFTAYAPPVPGEEFTSDNIAIEIVPLHEIILFDGMYINHTYSQQGSIGTSRVSYNFISGSLFNVNWEVYLMGTLYAGYWDVDAQTRIMENCGGNAYFGELSHTPFWVFSDISIGDFVPIAVDAEGDHNFIVSGELIYDISDFGPVEAWILEDLTLPGGIAYYEKSTGILLNSTFLYYDGAYSYSIEFVQTNATINKIIFDHDLRVSLDVPTYCEIDNTYTINATVINTGINDESNVDLFLYLDGVLVDSIHISSFPSGSSQIINYLWTPTNYGEYNFTAYAPAVIGETYTIDNMITELLPIHKLILFDGMFINYTFTLWGETNPLEYLYSYLSERKFHVDHTWYITGETPQTGYWDVDTQTRIMTNVYGGLAFGSGTHTPLWTFTEISINDVIPIAVDAEGDHDFIVSDELIYELPGFGLIEVWVLEDLTVPGGVAWYEKSTGILLNGTFLYYGGIYNYTFNFLDTNVEFTYSGLLSLTITTPDSTSSWETGSSQSITWASIGSISDVKIELYKGGVFEREIIASTTNDGTYNWDIPTDLEDGIDYQIKISDVSNPATYDESSNFAITSVDIPPAIPSYNLYIVIGIMCVVSVILFKKRFKLIK